jgi:type IV pilus assembly protein PilA
VNIIAKLRARRDGNDEDGFTLIELMVVVLIIAILIAIAIPTFLGARQRAQEKAAQSSLRNGLTAAKTVYTDNENYTLVTAANLNTTEPSLTFALGTASGTPKNVDVAEPDVNVIVMAAYSQSNKCFGIADNVSGGAIGSVGTGTSFNTFDATANTCTAADAITAGVAGGATGWKAKW